jgi:cytochrome oxidase Cu insertion factor (SCO1/SenC/PrrC family)
VASQPVRDKDRNCYRLECAKAWNVRDDGHSLARPLTSRGGRSVPVTPDISSAGLGPVLWELLLRCLAGALLAALVVGALAWARSSGNGAGPRARRLRLDDAESREPAARTFLRWSFGLLWILDGGLQAQPRMPVGFLRMIQFQAAAGPSWLASAIDPLARAWARHPVVADAATVWVQVGLGLLLLIGRRGPLARIAAAAVVAWSLVVWILGEMVGGLLQSGATWWTGAPGAVLVYLLAALALLLPWEAWTSGRAQLLLRRAVAVWLAAAAVLQALPAEGGWTAAGAAEPFASGVAHTQPRVFAWPIEQLATVALRRPEIVNGTTVVLVLVAAVACWFSGRTGALTAVLCLCAGTWWLAQDFGVLGGLATDPNTALPLGLLLASALPALRAPRSVEAGAAPAGSTRVRLGLRVGLSSIAVLLAFVVPLVLAGALPGPADSAALAADSGGGPRTLPGRPAPAFELPDQNGRMVSTAGLRGQLVLVTFLDAVCSSDCPLVANQLATADRQLGGLADRVQIVAIDTNPVFNHRDDVVAFTESHGLGSLPNWHFVWGPPDSLQSVLAEFGIAVDVPAVGMIEHDEGIYFITPDGREAAYLSDGATEQLTAAYSDQIRDEIRSLL